MMNILSNMRISHKISALMIGLVCGFMAIGVTYYIQVNVENEQKEQQNLAVQFQSTIADLSLEQVRMHAAASQYLQYSSEVSLDMYTQAQEKLNALLLGVSPESLQLSGDQSLQNLNYSLQSYSNTFLQAQNIQNSLSGVTVLQQNFDKLTQAYEQTAFQMKASVATSQLLSVRHALVTYFLNRTEAEFNLVMAQLAQMEASVKEFGVSSSKVKSISNDLIQFKNTLGDFNDSEVRLAELSAQLNSQANQLAQVFSNASASATRLTESTQIVAAEKAQSLQAIVTAIIFTVAILTAVGIYLIYHSIIFPMAHMQNVIRRINRGKTSARVKLIAQDELGDLGTAFNKLFDERIQQLEEQSHENDRLNNSIISLIRALGAIANKDLTVKVPVSEDITGTISDAVNLLTTETAQTLQQVKDISIQVNTASETLHGQAQSVSQMAEGERRQVIATSQSLEVLARAMDDVAKRSGDANISAAKAIDSTRLARDSVVGTVSGIRIIRETISETEKRMKRLGDRSQEISGIVNLINTIAERTHILALNASMHAASAGEAGKGFAVVADEVQRLAESARASTDEISAMVNNIRVETSDTVNIMNTLISQVADGSRMAEKAGEQMSDTEIATQALVETVKLIAEQATKQAQVANQVRDRATVIRKFTEKTAKELDAQRESTDGLRVFASTLVERVNIFTLPEATVVADEESPVSLKSVG